MANVENPDPESDGAETIVPCGVDARSGRYFGGPLLPVEVWAQHALEAPDAGDIDALQRWARQLRQGTHELVDGRDHNRLDEAGWGVVFSRDADPDVRAALRDLLALRRAQANAVEPLYREFVGDDGYRPGESKQDFLERHGAGAGAVEPRQVPYYLLLVGSPEEIPFDFQYQLDVRYAVGRLHFEPNGDGDSLYRSYARSVVAAEGAAPAVERRRRLALFGPRNPDDWVTLETSRRLVRDLGESLQALRSDAWEIEAYEARRATKRRLCGLLAGSRVPEVLLFAGHGLLYPSGHHDQLARQGALVCQEWEGPERSHAAPSTDCFLAAEDLPPEVDLRGLIAFFFSCFGAATSRWDEADPRPLKRQEPRAPAPFLARLPSRLLSQASGAALAVVAHVDQAFPQYNGAGHQKTFVDLLRRLMDGATVGWALETLNRRYAELASDLYALRERRGRRAGRRVPACEVFDLWTATNDSRGFVVLGDPAVRVPGLAKGNR